jgi:hypothetical protein
LYSSGFISLEILSNKANHRESESKLDHPYDINGSVIPVRGTILRFTPILIKAWRSIQTVIQNAAYFAKRSLL